MRKVVVQMLRALGYDDVLESANGSDAWKKIQREKIDLLLTDFNMPLMSGLELTRKVRETYPAHQLPILMFTTRNQREDIVAAVKSGVNGYIAKPFNAAQLSQHLSNVLEKYARTGLRAQANYIVQGIHEPTYQNDCPLVIIAEKFSKGAALSKLENREYTQLLYRIVHRLEALCEYEEAADLSYYLDSESQHVVRYIRSYRERTKMVIVSNEISGGGLTLARLARVNQSNEFVVVLIVNHSSELPIQARASLEKLGVLLLERPRLDDAFLEKLFRDELHSRLHIVPQDGLSPEKILQRIETDISLMTSLPVLPGVYHRIMSLSRYRNSDMVDWIDAIETDPLSSAMLIRRANSPIYGFSSKVEDAAKAVTLLGKSTVRELIIADSLRRSFSSVHDSGFHVEDYWAHSLATAMIARILSFSLNRDDWDADQQKEFVAFGLSDTTEDYLRALRLYSKFHSEDSDAPFTGGMMHDIGKVALVHCYPGLYAAFIETLEESKWTMTMRAAEAQASGVDHVQVGGILARNWELSDSLQQVIADHHAPTETDHLTQLISLSSFIASAFYSYPAKAKTPLKYALEPVVEVGNAQMRFDTDDAKTVEQLNAMLPEGLLQTIGISLSQVLQLAFVLGPDVRARLEEVRRSMKD